MKMIPLLGFLALVAAHSVAADSPGLTSIASLEDKTFFVDPLGIDIKWADALEFCHGHSLNLARIENLEEDTVVADYANGTSGFWLAITDLAYEGEFRSMKDNRPISYNNFAGENTKLTNCAAFGPNGTWDYVSCSSGVHQPLCESP